MQDVITVKRNRPSIVLAIVNVILFLLVLYTLRVLLNDMYDKIAVGIMKKDAMSVSHCLLFILDTAFVFLVMDIVNQIPVIVKYVTQPEMVAIRSSSLKNETADRLLKQAQKDQLRFERLKRILIAVLSGLFLLLTFMYGRREERAADILLYLTCMFFISFFLNQHQRKGMPEITNVLFEACDPQTYFDIVERLRMLPLNRGQLKSLYMSQLFAAYYLNDFDEMERIIGRVKKLGGDVDEILICYFYGVIYILTDQEDAFLTIKSTTDQMKADVNRNGRDKKFLDDIYEYWDMLLAVQRDENDKAYSIIQKRLQQKLTMLLRLDLLYYLAKVQMKRGEVQAAKENLSLILEKGGTMAIRAKAGDLLGELTEE